MDPRIAELHCIMPIANVPSVLANGILSYERAAGLRHASVALQPVQELRDQKRVPQGRRLHQYANLYFDARNPMLYKRLPEAASLCVLRISLDAMEIAGTVITDSNAASNYVRFYILLSGGSSTSTTCSRKAGSTPMISAVSGDTSRASAPRCWCRIAFPPACSGAPLSSML